VLSTNPTDTDAIYTLSLHDALPISGANLRAAQAQGHAVSESRREGPAARDDAGASDVERLARPNREPGGPGSAASGAQRTSEARSEEHTSELQSRFDLVCRLLLEKK